MSDEMKLIYAAAENMRDSLLRISAEPTLDESWKQRLRSQALGITRVLRLMKNPGLIGYDAFEPKEEE